MIKAKVLQEDFRRHLNRKNSEYSKSISVADGDQYLNEAIDFIFENLIVKFEVNDLVRNHLSQLKVVNKSLEVKVVNDEIVSAKYPDDLYRVARRWVNFSKIGCNRSKELGLPILQSSDINKTLRDPLYKPSWEWERLYANEQDRSLIIYKSKDSTIDSVLIDYIKKPNHIATPSLTASGMYVNSSGESVTTDVDFEIDSTFVWRRVSRLAAINALLDIGDINDYQAQIQELLNLDKIYLN